MANSRICSVNGCGKKHYSKGLCEMHYRRSRKYGDPLKGASITRLGEAKDFFQSVVLNYEGTDCLIWPYGLSGNGYGQIKKDGRMQIVNRLVCEEANGPPPTPAHEAAHSCGKGKFGCVTKRHLSWKTHADNMSDTILHGTSNRGASNGRSKLTETHAREILSLKGKETHVMTAKRFGVAPNTVSEIRSGRSWSWLQP